MKKNNYNEFFDTEVKENNFLRVSIDSAHNFFLGKNGDNKPSLLLYYRGQIIDMKDSKLISTGINKSENENMLWLTLEDNDYLDLFETICKDIICYSDEYSKDVEKRLKERWNAWRELLKNHSEEMLSIEKIKGLIGELYIIFDKIKSGENSKECIEAWSGPENTHHDFEYEQSWQEVKTITNEALTVSVSSIEQLDSSTEGVLSIVFTNKSSKINKEAYNLNKLYELIRGRIEDIDVLCEFNEKLAKVGYMPNEKYEELNYKITRVKNYNVVNTFPCLRREEVPSSIDKIQYSIIITELKEWEI